eukprot:1160160-Pelagomonas_calceolata.AAC.2
MASSQAAAAGYVGFGSFFVERSVEDMVGGHGQAMQKGRDHCDSCLHLGAHACIACACRLLFSLFSH